MLLFVNVSGIHKLREPAKKGVVDSLRLLRQHLFATVGDAELAALNVFDEEGMFGVGPCPSNPIIENLLLAAWKQFLSFRFSEPKLPGEFVYRIALGVYLAVTGYLQQRQHQGLVVGYRHRLSVPFD
jgi:hypothetical protein